MVTGGSNGIGAMIAEGLVRAGVDTYIVGRNEQKGREKAQQLSEYGRCIYLPGDIATLSGIGQLFDRFSSLENQLDILVNNAGQLTLEPIDAVSEAGWDGPMTVNLKAAFFMVKTFLPLIRRASSQDSWGRIINIGSAAGSEIADIEYYSYAASKAGVHHLTRALAHRLADDYITVNSIAPGVFPSDIGYEPPPEVLEKIMAGIPMHRFGEADDIVGVVVFLASKAGRFMTGNVLSVDGGKVNA